MYKKFFLILLLVVFIFSASSVAFGLIERPIKYGDLNGDGEINSIDAAVISRHILQVSSRDITAADLNGDGVVNSLDYTLLSRYILHEINEFQLK